MAAFQQHKAFSNMIQKSYHEGGCDSLIVADAANFSRKNCSEKLLHNRMLTDVVEVQDCGTTGCSWDSWLEQRCA